MVVTSTTTTRTVLNALTTPGIVTRIAEHLPPNDRKGLGALFLLINQPHVRYELEPWVVSFREKHRRAEIRRRIREAMKRIESMKSWEWEDRRQFNLTKAKRILDVYAYMGTVADHLHLLGKRLAVDIDTNMRSLLDQYKKPWFARQLNAERDKLRDYIEWGQYVMKDPNVPWYA
jgi:hypothetical protein